MLVEVEQSYSMYKNVLSPNCQRLTEDSLSKYMVVNLFLIQISLIDKIPSRFHKICKSQRPLQT